MIRKFRLITIGLGTLTLAGCSILDNYVPIPHPNLAYKRQTAYLSSKNASILQEPDGVNIVPPNQYYLVTNRPTGVAQPMALPIPPGSNIAYKEKHLPEYLALESTAPANFKTKLVTPHDNLTLQVNQTFDDTWNATALTLTAAGYKISGENYIKGNLTVDSGPGTMGGSYNFHIAILGDWRLYHTGVSLQTMNGAPVPKAMAKSVLPIMQKTMQQIMVIPHNTKLAPVVTITQNDRQVPYLLVNRDMTWSFNAIGHGLQKAGYRIVKVDMKKHGYFFVDTVASHGQISKNMPIYVLFIRSNGAYSGAFVIGEANASFVPAPIATPMIESIATQL